MEIPALKKKAAEIKAGKAAEGGSDGRQSEEKETFLTGDGTYSTTEPPAEGEEHLIMREGEIISVIE